MLVQEHQRHQTPESERSVEGQKKKSPFFSPKWRNARSPLFSFSMQSPADSPQRVEVEEPREEEEDLPVLEQSLHDISGVFLLLLKRNKDTYGTLKSREDCQEALDKSIQGEVFREVIEIDQLRRHGECHAEGHDLQELLADDGCVPGSEFL